MEDLFGRDELRSVSRLVFGQEQRLAVALVIARQAGSFTQSDVAEAIGARNASSVQGPMKTLLDAGFIVKDAATSDSRSRRYLRRDSALWALVEELYARADGQGDLFSNP